MNQQSSQVIEGLLHQILNNQQTILKELQKMGLDFTGLQAAVTTLNTNVQNAVSELNTISGNLTAAIANSSASAADQATLNGLVAQMNTSTGNLQAAVVADSPPAQNPPVTPPATPPTS